MKLNELHTHAKDGAISTTAVAETLHELADEARECRSGAAAQDLERKIRAAADSLTAEPAPATEAEPKKPKAKKGE